MDRRGFLGAILAAGVAPAFVRSGILMPVRGVALPTAGEITAVSAGLLAPAMVARESLRILQESLTLIVAEMPPELERRSHIVIRRPRGFSYG